MDATEKNRRAAADRARTDPNGPACFRLDPEQRLVPLFDSCCIAKFPVARPGKMGFRVVDNFCEEHIM